MKIKFILFGIGGILCINGLLIILAALVSFFYEETAALPILGASLTSILLGLPLLYFFREYDKNIGKKEGYLIVSLGWLAAIFSGTLPFLFTETVPSFTNAFFESTSGYTTTGATIINNVEALPKGILFWRSLMHWIGGMGIIVLAIAILPLLGIGGMQLFLAEAPGINIGKLHPRITQTAKVLWGIYVFYTILQTLLLWWAGMNLFDAINHSFSTLASGGFSTKNMSIAYWDNLPVIQYIICVFMFLAGMNFVLSYFLLKGDLRKIWNDDEFRAYVFIIFSLTAVLSFVLFTSENLYNSYHSVEKSFRHAIFQVLSVITTTGFISDDYMTWGGFAQMIIFGLMLLGACAGSTSGGVKIVRHLLMIKNGMLEFKRTLHPNAIIPTRLNGRSVSRNVMYTIMGFFILYMLLFAFGVLVISLLGNDFETALSASATSIGNVGIGLGTLNTPTSFDALSAGSKWMCAFLMFVGRLELLTVLILFTPYFWRKI